MKVNGWTLYKGTLFEILEDRLKDEVESLKNTSNYLSHPKAKLLKAIYKCTMEEIPKDPNNPCYRLGSKIRKKFKGYRRAKNYMPSRYRLFFRFDSRKKEIFYLLTSQIQQNLPLVYILNRRLPKLYKEIMHVYSALY